MASPFSAETREATLTALPAADVDVLVIGGGITGAGVARDAALRGLRVALVERNDYAAGTSSRSSKLIHGGVRYLQQGDIGLVRESAFERGVLRRIAPHLTLRVRMVMPTYSRTAQAKLGLGLWTFARVASLPADERHEMWSREETLSQEPAIEASNLHGAATFVEYLTDDARLVLATVKGAHAAGAQCVNHAAVTGLAPGPRTTEVDIEDTLTGARRRVRCRVVVNATGPWVDDVRRHAGVLAGPRLHLTKGVHLVVRHERLPVRNVVVMQASDGRSVFAIPRGRTTYLGTTDTDYGAAVEYPEVGAADADYLLAAANRTFAGSPLTRDDVVASWAGLRPLLHEEGKRPSEISRKDEIMTSADGNVISVAGGKLTTHRRMAERVLELVYARLGMPPAPCRTESVPLSGGEVATEALGPLEERLLAQMSGLGRAEAARLVFLYGGACDGLLARVAASARAAEALDPRSGLVRAEIDLAIEEEMALTLADLLERRTRLLLFDPDQGLGALEAVAEVAAARLGWDDARRAREIDDYRRLAASLRSFP